MVDDILQNLNEEQRRAVEHGDGPLLIVAGAGTGKTTVITKRIAHIIKQDRAKPEEILALTFTEKAATEMEERVVDLLSYGYFDLWISTFHSFAEKILREDGLEIGLPADFKLLNEFDQYILFKKNMDKFELDHYKPLGNPTKFIKTLLSHFSRAKDEDITPEQYFQYADELQQNLDTCLSGGGGRGKVLNITGFQDSNGEFSQEIAEQEVKRISEIANAYHVYQNLMLENNALDFGDLIIYCLKLFRERPGVLEKYRERFKYILLDEFQDTNWSQYELIKMLAEPKNNLVVVGDDDQCLPGNTLVTTQNGNKRIDKIEEGEKVAAAVGKGYLSHYKVSKVKKEKKKSDFITFVTRRGNELEVTGNHMMFCFIPNSYYYHSVYNSDYEIYYYVYLMYKEGLGWRLGITNDPATRLRMERSADKMVVIQAMKTEEEARYYENLYSLKYGIPTVCFAEREGVMTKRKWSEKLYQDLDVERGVKQLVHDLGVDLNYHQLGLDGVIRGGKIRLKIIIENCFRKYRSKYAKGVYLDEPAISHKLSIETSHKETLDKIENLGYSLCSSKKGKRLRITSKDPGCLNEIAKEIQRHIGGIIENRIKVAKNNVAHKKALVVPASNVLEGMFLPVVKKDGIYYEQITERRFKTSSKYVYDLEVEYAHNFIANNVVVHNSIFRFRGASMSNILQFKKDFPSAKQVFLTKNYRNVQQILDASYEFISQNNPNRLEYQLNRESDSELSKKLQAQTGYSGKVDVINASTLEGEMKEVVRKIWELKEEDAEATWDDFAVLARTNDGAKEVCEHLQEAGLPYLLYSSKGLYHKDLILDVIAYLKTVNDHYDNVSMYRVLKLPVFGFAEQELAKLNYWAGRKSWSLFEVLNNIDVLGLGGDIKKKSEQAAALLKRHIALAGKRSASELFIDILNESGLLKYLNEHKEQQTDVEFGTLLNQFMARIKKFEKEASDKRIGPFLEELQMEIDAGETGDIPMDPDAGPETIKVMTVHSAKGLEFQYVFITQMVDKRFPTTEKKEPLPLPDQLIKESLPEGDIHIEEERRLFYVALTRGGKRVYLSWAPDYGGKRNKKPSRFLVECGLVEDPAQDKNKKDTGRGAKNGLDKLEKKDSKGISASEETSLPIPSAFSFTQFSAFSNCPYQYKFAHILKIPTKGKPSFSFGKTMHSTLQKVFDAVNKRCAYSQADLFGNGASSGRPDGNCIGWEEILEIYKNSWEDDWFPNKKNKEEYWEKGRKILKEFYEKHKDNWPNAVFLEKRFNFLLEVDGEKCGIKGSMDRVDETEDARIKIVDYKTGKPKEKHTFEDKQQLFLYQLAAGQLFRKEVHSLAFYYLEDNSEYEFAGSEKDLEKTEQRFRDIIREIKKGEFPAKPSPLCGYCDFRDICEYRK